MLENPSKEREVVRKPPGREFLAGWSLGGGVLLAGWLWLAAGWPAAGAGAGQTFRQEIPEAARRLPAVGSLPDTQRLDLALTLPLRQPAALTNLLRQIYDPASPAYHHYLTPGQFMARFGPTAQDYAAVIASATAQGFVITGRHANRTLLDVNGSVASIRQAFHVHLRLYRHPVEHRMFYAPDTRPQAGFGPALLAVNGLNDYQRPHPMNLMARILNPLPDNLPLATGSGPRGGFIGRDFRAAYAPGVTWSGAGQTVGLFELDGYYPSDIAAYAQLAGIAAVPLTNVLVDGYSSSPGPGNVEVALDIDMAMAMAPGLAQVIVYEGSTPNDVLNRMAVDDAASQLSCSWAFGPGVDPAREQIFQQFALQGQSFFQAAGDLGGGGLDPPSDDPLVTSVGGTVLTTQPSDGSWLAETTWPLSSGGISGNYAIPEWQQGIDPNRSEGSAVWRNVPDVAAEADQAIWLICNHGDEAVVGGTSAAAPLWAGFAALANEQAAAQGGSAVGFANPAVYAAAESPAYGRLFHDIVTGNNTNPATGIGFSAAPGYDLCTGWGTPAGSNLIAALVSPPDALQVSPAGVLNLVRVGAGGVSLAAVAWSLTNSGMNRIGWGLQNTSAWFTVSPPGGSLAPGDPAALVTLSPTPAATNLPPGLYAARLGFTNLTDGFVQSRGVTLGVEGVPVITAQPAGQAVQAGATARFSVVTAANAAVAYQWFEDNGRYQTNVMDGGNVQGSAAPALVVSNVSPADAGAYWVVASNAAGVTVSSQAILAVVPWRPVITVPPVSQTVWPGQSVTLTAGVIGSPPLVFQWWQNGLPLVDGPGVSGSASPALTLDPVGALAAGVYALFITNSLGGVTSAPVALTVRPVTAAGVAAATVHIFTGAPDGAQPNGLAPGANGLLYGTTAGGGADSAGTIFQVDTQGVTGLLHSFTGGGDGAHPFAALTPGLDGAWYGTAFQGGAVNNGAVYRITPAGGLTALFSFGITNGDLPLAGLTIGTDGGFYSTAYQGGAYGRGTVYRVDTNGAQTVLHAFSGGSDGSQPAGGLVPGEDGRFYGTTWKGGALGDGVVFTVTTNGVCSTMVSLDETNGAFPEAGLTGDGAGNFYGVASEGGPFNGGTIFRVTSAGGLTLVHAFGGGTDGAAPAAALLAGSDGNFYGTTTTGGQAGDGTVFELTPDGVVTNLIQFDGYNGANPAAPLLEGGDGWIYGTTRGGGAADSGVIFRFGATTAPQITSQPVVQTVFAGADPRFSVAVAGQLPLLYQWSRDGVALTEGGRITGATQRVLTLAGVTTNDSGVYSVAVSNAVGWVVSSGALLTVTSSPPFIAVQPVSQTAVAAASVQFSVSAAGDLPLTFQWRLNGAPVADTTNRSGTATSTLALTEVTVADSGNYSVTVSNAWGGVASSNAALSVASVSAAGTLLSVVHWFGGGTDGQTPNGLMLARDGDLYGTTQSGGAGGQGTIFKITTNGSLTTLVSFSGAGGRFPGALPVAALVQDTNGTLHGATEAGGANGWGTVFALASDDTFTTWHTFGAGVDGSGPVSPLLADAAGGMYGVTTNGGLFGQGNIFHADDQGGFTNVYSFTGGADGGAPSGGLLPDAAGDVYGLAFYGGVHDKGAVYERRADGSFTNLYSFTGGGDGFLPVGTLVFGDDGALYGATEHNTIQGFLFYGTFFSCTTNGALGTLYSLNYTDGARPLAGLIQGSDGNFYGSTHTGATAANGSIFRLTPSGGLTTLVTFDGFDDGAHPDSGVVEGPEGDLYGTTSSGGPDGGGTIFRLACTTVPQLTSQPADQTVPAGGTAVFEAAAFGAPPLAWQWEKNGAALADGTQISGSSTRRLTLTGVSLADEGDYAVTVSNLLGGVASQAARLAVLNPPAFQGIALAGGTATFSWSAVAGWSYQVQFTTNLTGGAWQNLGAEITATNNVLTVSDPVASGGQRFYRVVWLP